MRARNAVAALGAALRTLQPWIDTAPGTYRLEWDGRDDAGLIVPPSLYAVRVQGRRQPSDRLLASGINWAVTT